MNIIAIELSFGGKIKVFQISDYALDDYEGYIFGEFYKWDVYERDEYIKGGKTNYDICCPVFHSLNEIFSGYVERDKILYDIIGINKQMSEAILLTSAAYTSSSAGIIPEPFDFDKIKGYFGTLDQIQIVKQIARENDDFKWDAKNFALTSSNKPSLIVPVEDIHIMAIAYIEWQEYRNNMFKVKITYEQLKGKRVPKLMLVAFVNALNGTEYTESLPADLSRHLLETEKFEWTFDLQLAAIQIKGIKEWIYWLWKNKLVPEFAMQGVDLCGADLSGGDLREVDLCEADLRTANLYKANLKGADLYGADLERANLSEANLFAANLEGANLIGANLEGADLYGVILQNAKYNAYTIFPEKFSPKRFGMIYVK